MVPFYLGFVLLLVVLTFKTVWTGCPNGWQDGVGMCYIQMKNTTDFVPWGYANGQCKALDSRGRLPVFKDAMSWNVFTMGVKQIKAQRMAQGTPPPGPQPSDIVPFGAYKLAGEWYWLDGSKMADGANNWQTGEPNGTKEEPENCVGFDPINGDTGYGDIQCSLLFGYVCQMDPGEAAGTMNNGDSQDATMSDPAACPAGWTAVGGACYKDTGTIAKPDDGIAACAKLDPKAKLPEFYNSLDFDAFMRYVGFKVKSEHLNIPLGFRKKGAAYVNSDGKPYYLNWAVSEPSGKECVYSNDIHGYMWTSLDCTETGYIYCQLDTRTVKSVQKSPIAAAQAVAAAQAAAAARAAGGGTSGGGQPYVNMVNGSPVKNSGTESFHRPENGGPSGSSDVAVISSLDTFSKYLQQSYTEEETFGRSVAGQLKKFNPTLKADVMYQIQLVLSMKMKQMW